MGLLNSFSTVKVSGENKFLLKELQEIFNKVTESVSANDNMQRNFGCYGPKNPWWNDINERQLREYLREFTRNLIDPQQFYDTVGFKEIRYPSAENLDDLLTFMHLTYRPKFIFFTRNLNDVCISKWHAKNPLKCKKELRAFEEKVENYITEHKEQDWFWLTYEDLVMRRDKKIKDFYKFLGQKFDKDEFEKVLGEKHGY